jgi:hypothetical protein
MHEYIARPVYYVGVHLFYASLVWLAAWTLTSMVRGTAAIKYWIWVATSLNFVLPLGAVLDKSLAAHLSFAIEHSGEHYRQLVVYYRANNLVPPDSRR